MLSARAPASLLYETPATDPSYLAAAFTLLAIGALAAIRPALRAAHSDPLYALRTE